MFEKILSFTKGKFTDGNFTIWSNAKLKKQDSQKTNYTENKNTEL